MTYILTIKGQDLESIKVLEKTAREMGLETEENCCFDPLDIKLAAPMNETARRFLEFRKKHPPMRVPNDVDINDIIDEVNNMDYLFESDNEK